MLLLSPQGYNGQLLYSLLNQLLLLLLLVLLLHQLYLFKLAGNQFVVLLEKISNLAILHSVNLF